MKLAQQSHSTRKSAACTPLEHYNDDKAFESLKKLAKTTGADVRDSGINEEMDESCADSVRHSAAGALARSPHPKAVAFLWTLAEDRYDGVRLTVLHKAAEVKTPEARAIILRMTSDAEERIRNEARRYLKKLADEDAGR